MDGMGYPNPGRLNPPGNELPLCSRALSTESHYEGLSMAGRCSFRVPLICLIYNAGRNGG